MAWAQVAPRGPVPGLRACFWTLQRACFGPSLSSGGLFLVPLFLRGPVSGPPLSSTDMFLEPLCLPRACFWTPLSSAGMFLHVLCLPRACLWTAFTLSSTMGLFLDPFFGLPGGPFWGSILVPGGPFWGSVLVPVVRLGVSVWLTFMAPSSRPRKYNAQKLEEAFTRTYRAELEFFAFSWLVAAG